MWVKRATTRLVRAIGATPSQCTCRRHCKPAKPAESNTAAAETNAATVERVVRCSWVMSSTGGGCPGHPRVTPAGQVTDRYTDVK